MGAGIPADGACTHDRYFLAHGFPFCFLFGVFLGLFLPPRLAHRQASSQWLIGVGWADCRGCPTSTIPLESARHGLRPCNNARHLTGP
jgi:hypothetical protein